MTFILEFHKLRGFQLIIASDIIVIGLGAITLVGMAHTMTEHARQIELRVIARLQKELNEMEAHL